jgi:phosphatidylcholine synthase
VKKDTPLENRNVFRFYTMEPIYAKRSRIGRLAATLVHAYTASGALLAFIGVKAVLAHDARLAFAMMFGATVVDATDGALARRVRVRETLPHVDGAKIDDLVDYLTFVFLPMLLLDEFGGLPPRFGLAVVALVLLSSAYGFAAADAKTPDQFFTGFPSYWNIAVLYLYVFSLPAVWNAVVLIVLSLLIFVRIGYLHPSRTTALRRLTLALTVLWAAAIGWLIATMPSPSRTVAIVSLLFPVYYTVLSFALHVRRAHPAGLA